MKPHGPVSRVVPRLRLVLSAALALLLWPSLMLFPGAPDASLDASWQEFLIHAHAQGWQAGREIVFTWGPWGFLNTHFHLGDADAVARLVWETVGKLLLACGLVALTQRVGAWRQTAFIGASVLCAWLFADTIYYVFISLAIVAGLIPATASRRILWLLPPALAFLACLKFTYTLLALGGVGLATAAALARREYRAAALIAAGFGAAFVLAWIAAGQHPDHLLPYFRRSLELSSGYADAMGMDETWSVFLCGAGLLVAAASFVLHFWRTHADRILATATTLYLGAAWFIVWKASFTRADGHVFGFFLYTLLLAPVLPRLCFPERRWHWFDLAPVAALVGIGLTEPGLLARLPGIAVARIVANARELPRLARLPAAWDLALVRAKEATRLPAVQAAVGRGSVDVFNYEQGAALLNDLRYTPRPVFQGYSAYTPRLAWRNLRFYQSSQAPDFILWKHQTIDGRFPTLDDAALVAELPRAYAPVLDEGDFLVLRKQRPLAAPRLTRQLLVERGLAFGEELALPVDRGHPLWLQVTLPLSKLGRLRAFLYKPPLANLVTTDERGQSTTWRLLPQVAADGFLLQPLLETQGDFAAYLRGQGARWLRSLRLEPAPGHQEFWSAIWDRPSIRLYSLPEIALAPEPPYAALTTAGVVNFTPESVAAAFPAELFTNAAGRVMFFHAPAELLAAPPPGSTLFTGTFGLRDGAHEGDARTDGVDFIVEAVQPDGLRHVLWHRYLDPLNHAADRGPQTFRVVVPGEAGIRIALRADPGPAGDTRWDWSYVGRLRFAAPAP